MKIVFLLLGFICFANAQWKQIGPRAYSGVIAVDPTNESTIYIDAVYVDTVANRQIMGIRKTTDGGASWTFYGQEEGLYFYSGGIKAIIVDPQNPDNLYVGGYSPWMAVARSTDGGQTWVKSDSGITPDHHGFTTQTMSFDSKRRILYAWDYSSFGGAYRSLDSAKTWQLVLPDRGAFHSVVDTISGTVYASTVTLSVSKDSGKTWSFYNNGISEGGSLMWLAKRHGTDTIYCVGSSTLYTSNDDGVNWRPLRDTLLDRVFLLRPIGVSQKNSETVYVGAQSEFTFSKKGGGIYRTTDAGVSWLPFAEGMPLANDSIDITGMQLIHDRVYINVATQALPGYGGLFEREDVVTAIVDDDGVSELYNFFLLEPYPNPFNSTVTIQFTLDQQRPIRLSIFDLLGREVIELATDIHNAGLHQVQWYGTGVQGVAVPTGIYFVRLESSKSIQTKKILLVR